MINLLLAYLTRFFNCTIIKHWMKDEHKWWFVKFVGIGVHCFKILTR
jgi:hypothetical protein